MNSGAIQNLLEL